MLYRFLQNLRSCCLNTCVLLTLLSLLAFPAGNASAQATDPGFSARLINLEGALGDDFRFQTTLKNNGNSSQIYELSAELPEGWRARFSVAGSRVGAVQIEGNAQKDITFEVLPGPGTQPGTYSIPLTATSPSETLSLEVEVEISGAYALQLTTPDGRVSTEVVSGSSKQFTLSVKNTGSIPLKELELSAQLPSRWEAAFEPKTIDALEPGKTSEVQVTLDVPEKTIAGDYLGDFSVKNANSEAEVSFRFTVKTSMLSGWIGLLVILLAIGLVYLLIRKYGRR